MTAELGDKIQLRDKQEFLETLFKDAVHELDKTQENAEYSKVLKDLPRSQIIVLIAAFKVAQKASLFNFEAVHTKYRNYMASHLTQMRAISILSKQAFLKIFLDLVDKGFLRSESDAEILSVNNKISLGFRL